MYADHAGLASRVSASTGSFGPIEVGMDAPDFEWLDEEGSSVRLSDLRGEPVLLAFFAAEWNPARTYQLQIYNEALQLLPNAGRVLGLAQDGQWCEVMFDGEQLRFPLLGNLGVDGEIARRYGVLGSQAIFVIDAGGTVRWRHVAADGMEPRIDDLAEALRSSAESRHISRREFLVTSLAVSVAIATLPCSGHAQTDTETVAPAASSSARPVVGYARPVVLNVNGHDHRLLLEPRATLLDTLRESLKLTGTKKGCDHGQCGACTVHVDGRRVNSCLTLAMQAEATRILTIEGLAGGDELHPMQAAFIREDGLQCGYCTPGQIMSAVACVQEGHAASDMEIREWMSGNICRCGAYNGIRNAIASARDELGHGG